MITMDWMPTLLAVGGTQPDPAYPSDGENLSPALTGAPPHSRKFYWRYKAGSQRAIRDGDWKYLRIAGNEFLFDVVQDPRERANLKNRRKDVFDGLKSDWAAWNSTMLEERSRPATYTNAGDSMADPRLRQKAPPHDEYRTDSEVPRLSPSGPNLVPKPQSAVSPLLLRDRP
jgi:arylsulfatase A-like enzyme